MRVPRWSRWSAFVLAVAGTAAASAVVPAGAGAAVLPHVQAKYDCTAKIPLIGTKTWVGYVTIHGASKSKVLPGGAVSFLGFQSVVTIPKALVDEAGAYASSISGKVGTFDINATDAKTATVNAAGTNGFVIPKRAISKTSPALTFKLPASPITVKGWTASKKGKMYFKSGIIALTLDADVSGHQIYVPTTCAPDPAALLSITTVV